MGRTIIWSPEAYELLHGILIYWEDKTGSKSFSIKLSELFQECMSQVANYPKSGRKINYKNIHYRVVSDYFIYYSFIHEEIRVLSICDMRRDPEHIKSLIESIKK